MDFTTPVLLQMIAKAGGAETPYIFFELGLTQKLNQLLDQGLAVRITTAQGCEAIQITDLGRQHLKAVSESSEELAPGKND